MTDGEIRTGSLVAVRLHEVLSAAGLPVGRRDGTKDSARIRVDWGESPSKEQEDEQGSLFWQALTPAHHRRWNAWHRPGFGAERLLAALWEQVVEGDDDAGRRGRG